MQLNQIVVRYKTENKSFSHGVRRTSKKYFLGSKIANIIE